VPCKIYNILKITGPACSMHWCMMNDKQTPQPWLHNHATPLFMPIHQSNTITWLNIWLQLKYMYKFLTIIYWGDGSVVKLWSLFKRKLIVGSNLLYVFFCSIVYFTFVCICQFHRYVKFSTWIKNTTLLTPLWYHFSSCTHVTLQLTAPQKQGVLQARSAQVGTLKPSSCAFPNGSIHSMYY